MSVIELLFSSFYQIVLKVTASAEWICMFLIAAFCSALIFNIIHIMTGGK